MGEKDIIEMSRRELSRLYIIKRALEEKITQVKAGELIGLSDRQIRRIIKRIRKEGDAGILHRSRGRPSNRRIPKKIKDKVIKLCREHYVGFGPTFAAEKLLKDHDMRLSDETLRLWFKDNEISYDGRKGRKHRQWRERKEHIGEMVQMDGSHHDWFEGRGPTCVLMAYIDDATGRSYARFYDYEGTYPAMESFWRYIEKYGIPQSVYFDRHSTYKSTAKPTIEEELSGKEPQSQFERALSELSVTAIHAGSPQAKGRIERSFRTFQDRLVKEMRLKGIKTTEEANRFLDRDYLTEHSEKFCVEPARAADLHRPNPGKRVLESILCIKTPRALRNDFTVAHDRKLYQIIEKTRARKVVVEERLDGTMEITSNAVKLKYKEIAGRPRTPIKKDRKEVVLIKGRGHTPSEDHPWRLPYKAIRRAISEASHSGP
jgi:Helix-turn-helix domain